MSQPPDRSRFRAPEPARPPRRPAGGLHTERNRPRGRRRLFTEARALHAEAGRRMRSIDGLIESLVDERLACLDLLVDCRDQLRPRWGRRHSRRRASVDEAPFPEAQPAARPIEGIDLRSVALTILRRHGPQRLRDLHGLIHLYGYRIGGVRPVQRLGDAMAYELRQGRAERLERGVYAARDVDRGPARYVPPAADLGEALPWDRPATDPGPPHLDPDVAADPELWSGAQWPTEQDIPEGLDDDAGNGPVLEPDRSEDAAAPTGPEDPHSVARRATPPPTLPAPAPPPERVGDDSPTNRRPLPRPDVGRPWEPPP